MFDEKTIQHLEHYVYALFADEKRKPFYIGKGSGNRVFDHQLCAVKNGDGKCLKYDVIRKAKTVHHVIVRHGLSRDESFSIESALIDLCNYMFQDHSLANAQLGHTSLERGLMTTDEVLRIYCAGELHELAADSIIISINKKYRRGNSEKSIYDATKEIWTISPNRLAGIRYVLSEYRGLIVEVFEVNEWYAKERAYGDNTKHAGKQRTGYGFNGVVAPKSIRDRSINKSIRRYKKKGQRFPITYKLDKVDRVINEYIPEVDFVGFAFKSNNKNRAALRDHNQEYRTRLIKAALDHIDGLSFTLIRDLFLEHTKWCRESWGADVEYTRLSECYFRRCDGRYFQEYLFALDSTMDTWLGGLAFSIPKDEFDPIAERIRKTIHKTVDLSMRKALEKGLNQIEDAVVKTDESE